MEAMKHDLNDKLNLLLEANEAIDILERKLQHQQENHEKQMRDLQARISSSEAQDNQHCDMTEKRLNKKSPASKLVKQLPGRHIFSDTDRVMYKHKYNSIIFPL